MTFYAKLVRGEASVVHAWDGWCEVRARRGSGEPSSSIPDEGSDLCADTMVVMESSENKAAAHAFIDYVLVAGGRAAVAEFTFYKVPNEAGDGGPRPRDARGLPDARDHAG